MRGEGRLAALLYSTVSKVRARKVTSIVIQLKRSKDDPAILLV
jgi:hypothetical protein